MFQRYAIVALFTCLGVGWANADDQTTRTPLTVPSIRQRPEVTDQSRIPIKAASRVDLSETVTVQGQSPQK
jgi:hypothetical protein